MWKSFAPALIAFLLAPSAALAQSDAGGQGKISSISSGEVTAQAMLFEMKLASFKKDKCYELGCLVVINETSNYDLIGFYIDSTRDGSKGWGRNRFEFALHPKKATLTIKTSKAAPCEQPVRFVFRHQKTLEEIEVEGSAALCSTPRMASLLRVKVLEPQVIWDETKPEATSAPPGR